MEQRPTISPERAQPPPAGEDGDEAARPQAGGGWRAFWRHPLTPLLVLGLALQLVREEYPFTHYPMYSRPAAEPNGYYYITDAGGDPLPVTWHTGMTPSRVGKQFLTIRLDFIRAEERRSGTSGRDFSKAVIAEFDERAGIEVLHYLREMSLQRSRNPERHLTGGLQLVEGRLRRGRQGLEETERVIATLEAEAGEAGAEP